MYFNDCKKEELLQGKDLHSISLLYWTTIPMRADVIIQTLQQRRNNKKKKKIAKEKKHKQSTIAIMRRWKRTSKVLYISILYNEFQKGHCSGNICCHSQSHYAVKSLCCTHHLSVHVNKPGMMCLAYCNLQSSPALLSVRSRLGHCK